MGNINAKSSTEAGMPRSGPRQPRKSKPQHLDSPGPDAQLKGLLARLNRQPRKRAPAAEKVHLNFPGTVATVHDRGSPNQLRRSLETSSDSHSRDTVAGQNEEIMPNDFPLLSQKFAATAALHPTGSGSRLLHPAGIYFNDSSDVKVTPISKQQVVDDSIPNIVIFGETGVGKSSIINLIANKKVARISDGALGCTLHREGYLIQLGDISCALWDTAGLDEGSEGTVAAKQAESDLKQLMQRLAGSGGIHLVIYCVRGSRLTQTLKRNYDLFYVTVCQKKVHIALVVTGLENQEGEMETWWTKNERALLLHGMQFDAHACVTSTSAENQVFLKKRLESQAALRELLVKYSRRPGWKSDPPFPSRIYAPSHSLMPATSASPQSSTRRVTFCGSFIESFPGTPAILEKSTGQISNKQYQIIRVEKRALGKVTPAMLEEFGGIGAGVLVFYTSLEGSPCVLPDDDIDALKAFYDIAGGPSMIVVLRGCGDESIAQACEGKVTSRYGDIHAKFVSLPIPITAAAQTTLEEMIEHICIKQFAAKSKTFW